MASHDDPKTGCWPVRVGRAPILADAFQSRPRLIGHINLGQENSGTVVVIGDGGTGKTQLVISLFRPALPRLAVSVWVSATRRTAIQGAYAEAWRKICAGSPEVGADAERDAQAFITWLEVTERPWIIVVDDLQDPADIRGLWPTGPSGWLIVTTRRRDPALLGHQRVEVDVGVYTPDEAQAFMERKLGSRCSPGVMDEAADLAKDLGHLPLALAQASAVILDQAITCRDYRMRFANRAHQLTEVFAVDTGDEYEPTLARTWSLALERADGMTPVGVASCVLRLAAVLDPNGVPDAIFITPAALSYITAEIGPDANCASKSSRWESAASTAQSALRNLHRLSLVTHDTKSPTRPVRMHSLAQRATLEQLSPFRLMTVIHAAADALLQAWPQKDSGSGFLANALALSGRYSDMLWTPDAHNLLFLIGNTLGDAGQIHAAISHFQELVSEAEDRLGPDHPATLVARNNLASWRGTAGDPSGAADALEELLPHVERVLGPDHPDSQSVRQNLTRWRGICGDAAGAATAFEQLLTDRLRILGPDHPHTLATRSDLARWRGEAGDAAGAAAAFKELLADYSRLLGPDHPGTLAARQSLAGWRGEAGDALGAASALEELLSDCLPILGPDNPATLATRSDLARWRGELGDAAGALEAFEELLADHLRLLGPDHPRTLAVRGDLAYWKGERGDAAGAVNAYQELLNDQMRILGPDHPDTLSARHNLAGWQGEAGDAVGAASALEELFSNRLLILGPDHPHTLATRSELARWRGEAGDAAGAEAIFRALLSDRQRVLGPDHPQTLATRGQVARWRGEAGDPVGAASAYEQLLHDEVRVLGLTHPDILNVRGNLAYWRGQSGDAAAAYAAYTELLTDTLRLHGADHPLTLTTRHNLVHWQSTTGDSSGAVVAYERLLQDRVRILGPDHPHTLATRSALARCLGEAGNPAAAVAGYEQLLVDTMRVLGPGDPRVETTRCNLARWRAVALAIDATTEGDVTTRVDPPCSESARPDADSCRAAMNHACDASSVRSSPQPWNPANIKDSTVTPTVADTTPTQYFDSSDLSLHKTSSDDAEPLGSVIDPRQAHSPGACHERGSTTKRPGFRTGGKSSDPSLSGSQRKQLDSALRSGFPTYASLERMLSYELDISLSDIAPPASMPDVVFQVIRAAESQDWVKRLITAATVANPGNRQLRQLVRDGFLASDIVIRYAVGDSTPGDAARAACDLLPQGDLLAELGRQQLEGMVNRSLDFQEVVPFTTALLEQAGRVCRVEMAGGNVSRSGTGFLVGPDLVLTNYHVLQDVFEGTVSPTAIRCRFDFRIQADETIHHGEDVPLARDWIVASSPPSPIDKQVEPATPPESSELDYAVLRLARAVGTDSLPGRARRGWIDIYTEPPPLEPGLPLLILQHPAGLPIKLALDTLGVQEINANGTRVTYSVITQRGSSGSPCFTLGLRLVALHHAGAPEFRADRTEGIPIMTIAEHLRHTGIVNL